MKILLSFLLSLLVAYLPSDVFPDSIVKYQGQASRNGKLVYIEKHTLVLDDNGKIKNAETIYLSPENKEIAKLASDFQSSLTTPNHTLQNLITGNIQGIKRNDLEIIMFSKNKGEDERETKLPDQPGPKTFMGCQGLNYYLIENLDNLKEKGSFPVRFLIPAKLDYYDFNISYIGETSEGLIEIQVAIDNWLLNLFAPKLKVLYDKQKKRIVYYEGLSNIPDEEGKMQNVVINYQYDS